MKKKNLAQQFIISQFVEGEVHTFAIDLTVLANTDLSEINET